uniref:NADH-ubiquinone oxidoreductase chain 2 n=1 Tax=Ophiophthalmus serratus TaxID=2993811 RepID=A0A9E8D0B8_9ECHI|nr:NADH dehydrogenase subunit 2 [Ophiophthalmus serratus]UZG65890.1 NADH dehydrogenase subunit 2 [Ophiophthalmus serratus]
MSLIILYNILIVISIAIICFSTNWLIIWSLIELATLTIIILINQSNSPRSIEAITKYFLIQSLAGIIILTGIILNYYLSGSLNIFNYYNSYSYNLLIIGLLIKLAIFPNPFWFIDVINGININYSIYIVIFSKIIPLYLYFILSYQNLLIITIIIGLLTIIFGSLLGINQLNTRKIIGFSSITHLGWIILSFPLLPGNICIFLLISYIIMVIPILWNLSTSNIINLIKTNNSYYSNINIYITIVSILSLGGLPPLLGFFHKWIILNTIIINNYVIICIIMLMSSLLSLFFYLQLCFSFNSIYWPNLKIILQLNFINKNNIFITNIILFTFIILLNLFIIINLIFINPLTSYWWI